MSLLTGVWGYLIAALVAAGLAAGGTYYVTSLSYKAEIATLQKTQAQQATASVQASMTQLQDFIKSITAAGLAYQQDRTNLDTAITKIHGDFANVTKASPLPPDCKPDAGRLSDLAAATAAANAHTAPGPVPGAAMPSAP